MKLKQTIEEVLQKRTKEIKNEIAKNILSDEELQKIPDHIREVFILYGQYAEIRKIRDFIHSQEYREERRKTVFYKRIKTRQVDNIKNEATIRENGKHQATKSN